MSIHMVGKRAAGFSNVKSTAFSTMELVDHVHRHTVHMGSYGVSEVGTGAGGMVNGVGLASGSSTGSGASGGGRIMGMETSVHNKLL